MIPCELSSDGHSSEQKAKTTMKHICIGITAHVDAGKTTLSEAMLFRAGALKKMGRVDHRDAFLDTFALERERGITIFSKQAEFSLPHTEVTLLDTPGHVDFSAEMERTLQVLDYAVLVISGTDGVQAHTETLWRLLARHGIPTFLFVNKMDLDGAERVLLLRELKTRLSSGVVDFGDEGTLHEELAVCDEALLERYFEQGTVADEDVVRLIRERKVFPCFFGSALRLDGVDALLDALADVSRETGKPMVTVLVSSKPQVLPRSIVGDSGVLAGRCNDPKSGAGSILWAPNPGMEGGQAIAEIILGEVNPSGRLPITFPCHAGQLPVYYNQIRGQHGNRYADLTQDPAFAFGEGEGYTTFAYGEPTIVGGASNADGTFAQTDTVHAEIALTNTGRRAGTEVVQAYVGDVVTSYSWADRELKAFRRVTLEPGETATVVFDIPVCDCTIADADANRIVEPGEFELLIGHSSRRDDLKRTTFTVA